MFWLKHPIKRQGSCVMNGWEEQKGEWINLSLFSQHYKLTIKKINCLASRKSFLLSLLGTFSLSNWIPSLFLSWFVTEVKVYLNETWWKLLLCSWKRKILNLRLNLKTQLTDGRVTDTDNKWSSTQPLFIFPDWGPDSFPRWLFCRLFHGASKPVAGEGRGHRRPDAAFLSLLQKSE